MLIVSASIIRSCHSEPNAVDKVITAALLVLLQISLQLLSWYLKCSWWCWNPDATEPRTESVDSQYSKEILKFHHPVVNSVRRFREIILESVSCIPNDTRKYSTVHHNTLWLQRTGKFNFEIKSCVVWRRKKSANRYKADSSLRL